MKRSFTLLELVIVIVLLSIAFSIFGIKIHKMIVEYRSKTSLQRIFNISHLCQEKAFFKQQDIFFILHSTKKGITCCYGVDLSHLKKEEIPSVFLVDVPREDLFFSSTGALFPHESCKIRIEEKEMELDLRLGKVSSE
jgi:prepilin-type N-terminal cleavage/methylation domain-containing protein